MKINLDKFINASIEQRNEWLEDGMEFDSLGGRVLDWVILFRDHGGIISDETMLKVYYALSGS